MTGKPNTALEEVEEDGTDRLLRAIKEGRAVKDGLLTEAQYQHIRDGLARRQKE